MPAALNSRPVMLAVLLAIGLFALCVLVGFAAFSLLDRQGNQLRNLLLSPALGLTVIMLATLQLSRLGLPAVRFAAPLTAAVALLSLAVLLIRRPAIPWRLVAIFGSIALFAFVLTDRPLLEFGFNFLSFSNADMAAYTASAERLVRFGYFQAPPHSSVYDVLSSIDQATWNGAVNIGDRQGSELLLAFVRALTGIWAVQIYMPVMAAGQLMLIWAGAALVVRGSQRVIFPAAVALALSLSSLTSLGVLYQLIAQEFGLIGLCFAVVAFQDRRLFCGESLKKAVPAIATATFGLMLLMIFYPELLSFLIVAMAIFVGLSLMRRKMQPAHAAFSLGIAIAAAAVVLNFYFLAMLNVGFGKITYTAEQHIVYYVFPFYLMPSGFANFWGLVPIARFPSDPWMSIAIGIGIVLSVLAMLAVFVAAWRRTAAGTVAFVMWALAIVLFIRRNDFGLYKLAMYIQPFLFASVAEATRSLLPLRMFGTLPAFARRSFFAAIPVALAAIGFGTQWFYVDVSRDLPNSPAFGFIEIPHASSDHLLSQLRDLSQRPAAGFTMLDAANLTLLELEGEFEQGHPMFMVSVEGLWSLGATRGLLPVFPQGFEERIRISKVITDLAAPYTPFEWFNFNPGGFRGLWASFRANNPPPAAVWNLSSTARLTIINRSSIVDRSRDVVLAPAVRQPDHLRFLNSTLSYYAGGSFDRNKVTMYQLEPDFFYPHATMSALGRYFLFEVADPSPKVRLILNLTSSLAHDGENLLPQATAIGPSKVPFPVRGRGSARLVSPPLEPVVIRGHSYLGIDLERYGKAFYYPRTGLMRLYGLDLPYDPRKIVAFGRDISAVSDVDYLKWVVPMMLSLPKDLTNRDLEYSGVYEDGWLSDSAYVVLRGGGRYKYLTIDGFVPYIGTRRFSTNIVISVDGRRMLRLEGLGVGEFHLRQAVALQAGRHQLSLTFTASQALPAPDDRKVTIKVRKLGFED